MIRTSRAVKGWILLLGWLASLVGAGCGNGQPDDSRESPTRGTIHISVDESFKPIIDSQIKVFESQNPEARIIAHYKPEAECLKDLLNDSIRMIIITRGLNPNEEKFMKEKLKFNPPEGRLAYDAVAVIVNNQARDSIFDMADLRSMLKGTSGYRYKIVMDGLSATSTVRYALDSLLKGQSFSGNVMAAPSSQGVIDHVSANKDAIGFVGVSWVGDRQDTTVLNFLQKVNIASIECVTCDRDVYVKPYQANIAMKRYPMVRGLHYILKENYRGLGSGFVNFLIYEKGQLIFRRAYLWPAKMEFYQRRAGIDED